MVVAALGVAGCPDDPPPDDPIDGGTDAGGLPPAMCTAGSRWAPGMAAYREVTEEWGLGPGGILANGVLMSAADIDGDGWVDLVVRAPGNAADDFDPATPVRTHWVLRNTGARRFEDVTRSSGLYARRDGDAMRGRPGDPAAFADVDNDGDLDAYTGFSTWNTTDAETSEILLGNGDGTFALGPEDNEIRAAEINDTAISTTFVDYDRDGNLDAWVVQNGQWPAVGGIVPYQHRLYRGLGNGTFVETTDAAGLTTQPHRDQVALDEARGHGIGWGGNACDLNGDGWPELLDASYGRYPNHLWQNAGDGTFANRSIPSGYAFDALVDWTDNQPARCFCQANPTAPDCAGVPAPEICDPGLPWDHDTDRAPSRLGGNSGTTVCADIDNDGHLDLWTSEIRHRWAGSSSDASQFLINTGEPDVRFMRVPREEMGIALSWPMCLVWWDEGHITASVFDFDNDGWKDLWIGASDYPGNHGLLFHQDAARTFTEVPPELGVALPRAHGSVAADFDRDGDLDLVVGHFGIRCDPGGARCWPDACEASFHARLYENVIGQGGNWIQLDLEGTLGTNRGAIGARVEVRAGDLVQVQEIDGGFGLGNTQRDRVLHFGLGAACEAEVTVRWPNAALTTQTFRVNAGWRYHVRQGEAPTWQAR